MKIHEVKRMSYKGKEEVIDNIEDGTFSVKVENAKLFKEFVDAPLVEICEELHKKNLKTFYSDCNSDGKVVEEFYASLGIDAATLSLENLGYLRKLMENNPENIRPAFPQRNPFYSQTPNIIIQKRFSGDTDMDKVTEYFKDICKGFATQEKILDNGVFPHFSDEQKNAKQQEILAMIKEIFSKMNSAKLSFDDVPEIRTIQEEGISNTLWKPGGFEKMLTIIENATRLKMIEKDTNTL